MNRILLNCIRTVWTNTNIVFTVKIVTSLQNHIDLKEMLKKIGIKWWPHMSSKINHSSIEGNSDRAFILRKILSYGKGTRFELKKLIEDVQSEREISDRQILGILRRYNGIVVQNFREENRRVSKWEVLMEA